MNKKNIWLLLPTILLPHVTLLMLAIVLLSTKVSVFEFILERVFREKGLYMLAALLVFFLIAVVLSITYFVLSIWKKWDPVALSKCALIIKWVQTPAYIVIFVLGFFLMITLFTIPFALMFVFVDCLTLFLTGLLTISAALNAVRQGVFQTKEVLWVVMLQFVFCADVVAATVFYAKLRKKAGPDQSNQAFLKENI